MDIISPKRLLILFLLFGKIPWILYRSCTVHCPIRKLDFYHVTMQSISFRITTHYVVFKLEYHARVCSRLQWGIRALTNTVHRKTQMMLSTKVEQAILLPVLPQDCFGIIIYIIHLKTLRSGNLLKYYPSGSYTVSLGPIFHQIYLALGL